MADTFGSTELPASPTDLPVGDPALLKLGTYLQAVINAQLGTAWDAMRPRDGDFSLPVRAVLTHDPRRRSFNDARLPALFVFRTKGGFVRGAEEFDSDATDICVIWIYPPEIQIKQVPREPFANAVAKVVRRALELERHPSWVDAGDPDPRAPSFDADVDSIVLAQATSTSAVSLSGAELDGAIGDSVMAPRRGLTITTSTTGSPAYNTSDPIEIAGVNLFGLDATWSLQLTQANGGETVALPQDVAQVTQVDLPEMLSALGSISIGTAAVQGRGSNARERCRFDRCRLRSWQPQPFQIGVETARGKGVDNLVHDMVEMHLDVIETYQIDLDTTDGVSLGDGADLTVVQGTPFDAPSFTIERTLD